MSLDNITAPAAVQACVDLKVHITLFKNVKCATPMASTAGAWKAVAVRLIDPKNRKIIATKNKAPLLSFAMFDGKRGKAHIKYITAVVLDFDDGTPIATILRLGAGIEFIVYTTHSHTIEKPKFRVIIPLSRPVSASEYPALWVTLNALLGGTADEGAKDASRISYWPSCPPDKVDIAVQFHNHGNILDPDALPAPIPAGGAMALVSNSALLSGIRSVPNFTKGVAEGERDVTCIRYAGWLLAGRRKTYDEALAILLEWNTLNDPTMPEAQVRKCLDSAARMEAEKLTADLTPEQEKETRRLAELPPMQYDQQRKAIAENFGIRVSTLDDVVDRFRPEHDEDTKKSGSALSLPMPEPWPEPVDGAALLDEMEAELTRYVILPDGAGCTITLWAVQAHVFMAFSITPRLTITSPEKRCGKTRVLELLYELTPRPLLSANVTPAAMFRTIEAMQPTLLIDEADTFATDKNELRGIVNSGYKRNGCVVRTVGDDHEPRAFSTWCSTVFAAIGKLPDTIEDRSIIISMRRRKPGEKIKNFRAGKVDSLKILARKAARWAKDNMEKLGEAEPDVPPELSDRAADNWGPLFAIADAAGGEWPKRARQVAIQLSGAGAQEDQSVKVQLLADILDVFKLRGVEKLPTIELLAALHTMQDRPWGDWSYGKAISPTQLATLLKPFGIRPKDVRIPDPFKPEQEKVLKGYELAQFADAFSRYL